MTLLTKSSTANDENDWASCFPASYMSPDRLLWRAKALKISYLAYFQNIIYYKQWHLLKNFRKEMFKFENFSSHHFRHNCLKSNSNKVVHFWKKGTKNLRSKYESIQHCWKIVSNVLWSIQCLLLLIMQVEAKILCSLLFEVFIFYLFAAQNKLSLCKISAEIFSLFRVHLRRNFEHDMRIRDSNRFLLTI